MEILKNAAKVFMCITRLL